MTISALLSELDAWFNEAGITAEKAKLLSKLATLEYCGWLEERFDQLVLNVSTECQISAADSVKGVIKGTHGFTYHSHLREMLVVSVGERGVNAAELLMESAHPNQLAALVSALSTLKVARGFLAHNSSLAAVPQQVTINAPSWCINQQRIVAKQIDRFEAFLLTVSQKIHAAL
jgi:hypothetical protein